MGNDFCLQKLGNHRLRVEVSSVGTFLFRDNFNYFSADLICSYWKARVLQRTSLPFGVSFVTSKFILAKKFRICKLNDRAPAFGPGNKQVVSD